MATSRCRRMCNRAACLKYTAARPPVQYWRARTSPIVRPAMLPGMKARAPIANEKQTVAIRLVPCCGPGTVMPISQPSEPKMNEVATPQVLADRVILSF